MKVNPDHWDLTELRKASLQTVLSRGVMWPDFGQWNRFLLC